MTGISTDHAESLKSLERTNTRCTTHDAHLLLDYLHGVHRRRGVLELSAGQLANVALRHRLNILERILIRSEHT